jgi:hypothetical protein
LSDDVPHVNDDSHPQEVESSGGSLSSEKGQDNAEAARNRDQNNKLMTPNVAGDSENSVMTDSFPKGSSRRVESDLQREEAGAGFQMAHLQHGLYSPCSTPSLVEETALLEAIDALITAAEERELMAKLDQEILHAEEQDLLKTVLDRIEDTERKRNIPFVDRVIEVGAGPDDFSKMELIGIELFPSTGRAGPACSNPEDGVQALLATQLVTVTKLLPKFLPGTNTRILTSRDLEYAITKAFSLVNDLLVDEKLLWTAKLQDVDGQPDSVLLTASLNERVVDFFKEAVQFLVGCKISDFNRAFVLSKGQTIEIEVNIGGPLKGHFTRPFTQHRGLWMDVHEGGAIAKSLRNPKGIVGCCLLQMDGIDCINDEDAVRRLEKARANPSKRAIRMSLSKLPNVHLKRIESKKRNLDDAFLPAFDDVSHSSESRDSKSLETQENDDSSERLLSGYDHFSKKYKEVRELEFNGSGIHQHFVNHCMWSQHKALKYGSACDDNCPCPSDLKLLTETVIRNHLKKQGNPGGGLRDGEFPVGFVNRFAPTFFPRVREQYPNLSMGEILTRVVAMWSLHQMQATFGMVCKETCSCAGGWQMVFHLGDPSGAEASRKKKVSSEPPQKKCKASSQPDGMPLLAETASAESIDETVAGSKSEQRQYQVDFDARQPLGFYVATVKNKCKIVSVCPLLAPERDGRLRKGTIVCAAAIGAKKVKLSSHDMLRKVYYEARASKAKVSLWFINTDVVYDQAPSSGRAANREWSQKGEWQGRPSDGWAGGAVDVRVVALHEKSNAASTKALPESSFAALDQDHIDSTELAAHQEPHPEERVAWEIVNGAKTKEQNYRPPQIRSILKPARNFDSPVMSPRNVTFDEISNAQRVYLTMEAPCCWIEKRMPNPGVLPPHQLIQSPTIPNSSSLSELLCAIESKEFSDVIEALQAGAPVSKEDPFGRSPKKVVIDCSEALDRQIELANGDTSRLEWRKQDFQLKRKVLNIYINAEYVIDKARHMKNWKRFDVRIERLKNVWGSSRWTAKGFPIVVSGVIKTSNSREELVIGPLPETEVKETTVDWTGANVLFPVHYNEKLPQEKRELVVYLEVANIAGAKIGSISIPIDRISEAASGDNEWHSLEFRIAANEWLASGDLLVMVRKTKLMPEYLVKKQKEAKGDLEKVIRWIDQFQAETQLGCNTNKKYTLPGGICGTDGVSLLHAAIFLEDDAAVKKLLALGASPNQKSPLGTPRHLAANMADRATHNARFETIMELLRDRSEADYNALESQASHQTQEQAHAEIDCSRDRPSSETTQEESKHDCITVSRAQGSKPGHSSRHEDERSVESDGIDNCGKSTSEIPPANSLDEFGRMPCPADKDPSSRGRESILLQLNTTVGSLRELSSSGENSPANSIAEFDRKRAKGFESVSSNCLPAFNHQHWMTEGKRSKPPCRYFHPPNWCDKGARCPFLHVVDRLGAKLDDERYDLHDFSCSVNPSYLRCKHSKGPSGQDWFTAGYYDPDERIYYYAERGRNAERSEHGICWYPTKEDAQHAVSRVVERAECPQAKRRGSSLDSGERPGNKKRKSAVETVRPRKKQRPDMETSSLDAAHGSLGPLHAWSIPQEVCGNSSFERDGTETAYSSARARDQNSSNEGAEHLKLPSFNDTYWMLTLENFSKPCIYFNKPGGCVRNNRCKYAHVLRYLGPVLDEKNEDSSELSWLSLEARHLHFKHSGPKWVTVAYFDNMRKIFYRAERGEGSQLSGHEIYWYPSKQLAEQAVRRVVAFARKNSPKKAQNRSPRRDSS